MTRPKWGLAPLIATLAVTGAFATTSAARPQPKPWSSACNLLRKTEVAGAIGEPIKSTRGGKTATGARYCNWTGKDSSVLSKGISVIAARDFVRTRYAKYRALMRRPTPVKGLGDVAATDGQVIIARQGKRRFLYIAPLYTGTGIGLGTLKSLALKALRRL